MLFNYEPPPAASSPRSLGDNSHWFNPAYDGNHVQSLTTINRSTPSIAPSQLTMFSHCPPSFIAPSSSRQSDLTLSMELVLGEVPVDAKNSLIDFIRGMGLKPFVDRTEQETIVTVNVSKLTDADLKNRFIDHLKKYTKSYSKNEDIASEITIQDVVELTRNQKAVRFPTVSVQVSTTDLTSKLHGETCSRNDNLILKPSPVSMPNDINGSNSSDSLNRCANVPSGTKNKKKRALTRFFTKFKRKAKKSSEETSSMAGSPEPNSKRTTTSEETTSKKTSSTPEEAPTTSFSSEISKNSTETETTATSSSKKSEAITALYVHKHRKLRRQSVSLPSFVNDDVIVNTSLLCPNEKPLKGQASEAIASSNRDHSTYGIYGHRDSGILLSKKRIVLRGSDTKYASILHGDKDFQTSFEPLNQFKRPTEGNEFHNKISSADSTETAQNNLQLSNQNLRTRFLTTKWWSSAMSQKFKPEPPSSTETAHFTDSMSDLTSEVNCLRVLNCWKPVDSQEEWVRGSRGGFGAGGSESSRRRSFSSRFDDKIEVRAVKYVINSLRRTNKKP